MRPERVSEQGHHNSAAHTKPTTSTHAVTQSPGCSCSKSPFKLLDRTSCVCVCVCARLVVHFVFFISIATATRPLLRLVCGTVRNVCPNVGLLMEELVKSRVPINGYRFESRQYFLKNIFSESFFKTNEAAQPNGKRRVENA